MMAWLRNTGIRPTDAIRKRVRVRLANGTEGSTDPNPMSPPGWAAGGPTGCRWSITGCPFDIAEYEVIE